MRYRRSNVTGGTYFFTVNLEEHRSRLLVNHVGFLRDAVRVVKERHPFHIDAFVVLPDHLHAIWTLPESDADFATRWMLIKSGFSRCVSQSERIGASRIKKGERGIWQRRYWEHFIRNEKDYEQHVDYVHYNPVKHGYVKRAVDWPYSSIRRYIAMGVLPEDWGETAIDEKRQDYGER